MDKENRRHQRFAVRFQVRFKTALDFVVEYAENLSAGGLFVRGAHRLEPLTEVEVEVGLPGYGQFTVRGKVAHIVLPETAAMSGRRPGAGLEIIEAPDGFRDALGEYLRRLGRRRDVAAVALGSPLRSALFLAPVLRGFELMLYPAVVGLNLIGAGLLRLFGVERRFGAQRYTAEELQDIVWESEESGLIGSHSASVVAELVDFSQLTAGEAMIPRVQIYGIEVGSTMDDITRIVRAAPHTRYPVYAHDLDHIVGMIHIKDLVRGLAEGRPVRQTDLRAIPFVAATTTLAAVLETMRRSQVQMAVVMDEHGGTDGIITTEDLFEEVVGDIQDEVSAQPPDRHVEADGALIAAGTVRIDEVGEHFDVDLEHEEVDTVSGLVLSILDRPPEVGDSVRWDSLALEVVEIEGHGVARARIRRVTAESQAADPGEQDGDRSH